MYIVEDIMVKAKLKAACLHGAISVCVALLTAALVFGIWYPREFSRMVGGADLFLLVLGVEIAAGPLMSLVIFNPRKSRGELVRDYSFVGLVQLCALFYGLFVVAQSRPVYLAFVKDRIEVVVATELEKEDLREGSEEYRSLPWWGPQLICTQSPSDSMEKSTLLLSALNGKDIQLLPKYYRKCRAREIENKAYRKDQFEQLTQLELDMLPPDLKNGDFGWLPAVTRFGAWTVFYPRGDIESPVYLNMDPFVD